VHRVAVVCFIIKRTKPLSSVSRPRTFITASHTFAVESGMVAVRRVSKMILPVLPFLNLAGDPYAFLFERGDNVSVTHGIVTYLAAHNGLE
jgi:hypothetical protein